MAPLSQLNSHAGLSYRDTAQFDAQSRSPGPDDTRPHSLIQSRPITIHVVLEDGSPLPSNPVILLSSDEDCHISAVFRDGTVKLDVRTRFGLGAADGNAQGPGCLLWKVTLPGYQSSSGYVRDGAIV